jgi:tetratricopeptide (TPR) repeat protein
VDLILRELIKEFRSEQGQADKSGFMNTLADALRQAEARGEETLALRLRTLFAYTAEGAERSRYVGEILKESNIEKSGALTLLLFAEESLRRREYAAVYKVCDHFSEAFKTSDILPDIMNNKISALIQEAKYPDAVALAGAIAGRFGCLPQTGLTRKLKADALRLSKQYEEAVKTYNELFAVREWRGPLIPEALYWIGCCFESQGKPDEAFAFFQRVYVLYEGYAEWSAKAYEGSVRCLEKLGRRDDMQKTLREMLSRADIAATPEGRRAQTMLKKPASAGGGK